MNPLLLLRTLKYLRWEQVVYRPIRLAQYRFDKVTQRWRESPFHTPEPDPEAVEIIRFAVEGLFAHLKTDYAVVGTFTFLNRTLKIEKIDWNQRYESHLWNYYLHYFSYAVGSARAYAQRAGAMLDCQKLIESWIDEARIGHSDGWDAYPVSLRVVNWIYAYALIADAYPDRIFLERWRASIYRQLDFLSHRLEFHLLANHLLKNVKAMVIGGLFFNNARWLKEGGRLLWREFDEQVLTDGGHYERSPMYHAQALVDFLECYCLLRNSGHTPRSEELESRLRAMAGFLEAMSYQDGTLALFNDSANVEEIKPQPIIETAKRVCGYQENDFPREFKETGYFLWISLDEKEKIIVDAGPPSVDYNSAHAHCDLLSYELWLDGLPFIVDSGVHGYGGDRFREYCRSTRAHNTVMIDEREQSEMWGTFRMARRAELIDSGVSSANQDWVFHGGYRPYYDSRLVHRRHIRRKAGSEWYIEDRIIGGNAKQATSFIHLHHRVRAGTVNNGRLAVACSVGELEVMIEPFAAEGLRVIEGWYFPDFGVVQQNTTICIDYHLKSGEPFGYRIRRRK